MIDPDRPSPRLAIASLLALLALCGCAKPDADDDAKPTALVTTALAVQADMPETVTAYGAAEFAPDAERTLIAPVEALVSKVLTPAGATVVQGQPVVILAPSPASQLDLNKAEADAAATSAAYDRARRLRAAGLDSDADVETAKAANVAAGASARSLHMRTGAALTLSAPQAGVVEGLSLAPGDLVAQGALVARIGALNGVRVRLGVEPAAAARLRVGATAELAPLAGGAEQPARVALVDPRLDPQTRLASVILSAPDAGLSPGEPLRARVVLRRLTGAVVVPRSAVLYEQEQPYVFVVQNGTAHRRDVKLGPDDAERASIAAGLAPRERVVVDGASALDDGMAVREGKAAADSDANP